jgi:hypothetical protein
LLVVKELVAQHRSVTAEAPPFGLTSSRFALEKLQRQAARLAMSTLEEAYVVLRDVDVAIKMGRLDAEVAVELVVAHLAGIAPAPPPTVNPQTKWTIGPHLTMEFD